MTEVNRTAAYIRVDARREAPPPSMRDEVEIETWSLLRTAHTVESLLRTLGDDSAYSAPETERRIVAAMRRWLDEERIELATDS